MLAETAARVYCARMQPAQRHGVRQQSQPRCRQRLDTLSTARHVQDVRPAHTVRAVLQHRAVHVQHALSTVAPMPLRAQMLVPDTIPPDAIPAAITVPAKHNVQAQHTVAAVLIITVRAAIPPIPQTAKPPQHNVQSMWAQENI